MFRLLRRSLLVILFAPGIVWAIEEPAFERLATIDGVEYRQYPPYLVAEIRIDSDSTRNQAANIGFRRLFNYISGDNRGKVEIEMTAPVRQQQASAADKGIKISMTAPVRQRQGDDGWNIAFVLPQQFTEANAPQPNDPQVSIKELPGQLVAVLRYSGRWTSKNVRVHTAELLAQLRKAGAVIVGEPVVAYYNAPFSLPFMRRNEIMVAVDGLPVEPVVN